MDFITPMMLDIFGHLSYILIGFGTYLVARKNTKGWWVRATGNLGWVIIGCFLGLSSIILWEGAFLIGDLWFGYKWKNETKKETSMESRES